jgi:MFS transporter, OFA family, oxalate/formate antiporter
MVDSSPADQRQLTERSLSSKIVSKSPVYYGWVILAAGTLGLIMTSPGQTYVNSIFIDHFIRDLDISRSLVSMLYLVGTLTASLALPWVGRQVDLRGQRLMAVAISVAFGLACLYMGFVRNALMLLIGFTLLRMLGQGSLSLVSTNIINQWWVRRRGPLLGLSGVAMALLGVGAFPNVVNWLIPHLGWRMTYGVLGAVLLLVMTPVAWLFFRNRPEEYGLLPDGLSGEPQPAGLVATTPATSLVEEHWTVREAMGTPVFWVFLAGLASISMLGTGVQFHIVSIFADNGLTPAMAAASYVPIAVTSAALNLASGILVDRIRLRVMMAIALVLQALSLWMVAFLGTAALALAFGIVIGATTGLMRTVSTVAWAKYYGRRHLGSISGVTSTVLVAASALGPLPMGVARDWLGTYTTTLNVLAIIPLGLAVASLFVDRPAR